MPGEKLVEGGIYNSNRFVLRGLLHQLGCDVVVTAIFLIRLKQLWKLSVKPHASLISF